MSKKRDKNARKKVVRKRALAEPRSSAPPELLTHGWVPAEAALEPEPVVDAVAAKDGGGAMGAIRRGVTPGRGRSGDTLLTRRRSPAELSLWLAGAGAVVWLVWKLIRVLNPPI